MFLGDRETPKLEIALYIQAKVREMLTRRQDQPRLSAGDSRIDFVLQIKHQTPMEKSYLEHRADQPFLSKKVQPLHGV